MLWGSVVFLRPSQSILKKIDPRHIRLVAYQKCVS